MLQDRRRPLWPVALLIAPLIAGMALGIFSRSDAFMPILRIYFLLLSIGAMLYMVREVRRYGRWLRDNYADLEHKEVWQSFVVLAVIFVVCDFYVSGLRICRSGVRRCTHLLSPVAGRNAKRPEYPPAAEPARRRAGHYRATKHLRLHWSIATAALHRYATLFTARPEPFPACQNYWH